jgi:hypothetical protein
MEPMLALDAPFLLVKPNLFCSTPAIFKVRASQTQLKAPCYFVSYALVETSTLVRKGYGRNCLHHVQKVLNNPVPCSPSCESLIVVKRASLGCFYHLEGAGPGLAQHGGPARAAEKTQRR